MNQKHGPYNQGMQMETGHGTVKSSTARLGDVDGDLLVIPVLEEEVADDLEDLDRRLGGALSDARARREFRGKEFEQLSASVQGGDWQIRRVLLVGAGRGTPSIRQMRRLGSLAAGRGPGATGALGRLLLARRHRTRRRRASPGRGTGTGTFDAGSYKTDDDAHRVEELTILAPSGDASVLEQATTRGELLGECSNEARRLANEPGNALTPQGFAERARTLAANTTLEVEILEASAIEALGMGMLMGVARGSVEPPRVIVPATQVGRGRGGAGSGPGGEGRDVRQRWNLAEAGRIDGAHEGRHGWGCGRPVRDAGHQPTEREGPGPRRHSGNGEPPRGPRREARRCAAECRGEDRRGHQYRCRRSTDLGRRAVVREATGRHSPRRRGDPDGRVCGRVG